MLKQMVKNEDIIRFLNEAFNYYVKSKKLTTKNINLMNEYTQYLKHKVDGMTETQRLTKGCKLQ